MFSSPEFWVAVAFVIVVVGLFKPGSKAILSVLDKRANRIRQNLEEAQQLREEAQKTLAEYQRMQRDAGKEAEEILDNAKNEAKRLQEKAAKDLENQLARREQHALEKIAQAEAKALQEVRDQAVQVAIAATTRLLRDQIDQPKSDALIDEAIKDLPKKLN